MSHKFTLAHFHPYSIWSQDTSESRFSNGNPQYIVDSRTGDRYFNEDSNVIRFKCFLLSIGTPVVHTLAAIVKAVYNILKLLSFYDFWKVLLSSKPEQKPATDYSFKQCATDAGLTLFNIIFAPIAVLLLQCAALYGLFMPRDGRKVYASLERFTYGHFVLAPCFQPEAKEHFFGGDPNTQNAM